MLWYKDSELINDSTRGGIRVVSEQQMKTSNLVISRVTHTDSGNYTCAADNSSKLCVRQSNWILHCNPAFWFCYLDSDSVFVHIINSEKHAAMQHELASRLHIPRSLLVILTFFYVSIYFLNDRNNGKIIRFSNYILMALETCPIMLWFAAWAHIFKRLFCLFLNDSKSRENKEHSQKKGCTENSNDLKVYNKINH